MIRKLTERFKPGRIGSALIMTIVLTVLLSIVAVMFVAVARMDMAATSNIANNKMLDSAAKSIIEIVNKELVRDVPGAAGQEYYDYPDANNAWLASIEPYLDNNSTPNNANDDTYRWRQISDVTGYLSGRFATRHVKVDPPGTRKVILEYPEIILDANSEPNAGNPDDGNNNEYRGQPADADGDGILDSKWFELKNMRTSKGRPIYAAVRVIDNSGMVNINTTHSFDANSNDANKIDGTSQMQINLKGLLKGTQLQIENQFKALHSARCGTAPDDWNSYSQNVIWQYGLPNGNYTPFDISDELELRYRYCTDSRFISRFEVNLPYTAEGAGDRNFGNLYDGSTADGANPWASNWRLSDWQYRITEPNYPHSDRRHLLTTLSLDRIIQPDGNKMTNINTDTVGNIYQALHVGAGLSASEAAQIAVNIIDYRDSDSNVTDFKVGTKTYYGFERPCIYISELAFRQVTDTNGTHKSYAIELYRPYLDEPNGWKLISDAGWTYDINWPGTKHFYVITWENPGAPLDVNISDANVQMIGDPGSNTIFGTGNTILLTRQVDSNNAIVVDSTNTVLASWPSTTNDGNYSIQRDITPHKCIRRLWDPNPPNLRLPTLGRMNDYNTAGDANYIQAYPKNSPFTNIGEIGMIFRNPAYCKDGPIPAGTIGYYDNVRQEYQVRLNLADPNYQKIFKYLTVIDPNNIYPSDPNYADERRIKGRININTAPVSVLAQLPWVSQRKGGYDSNALAKAIVAYRDKTAVPSGDPNYSNRPGAAGFQTIGQLCDVCDVNSSTINYGINYYGRDGNDLAGFPDLDPNDGAADDFEERDLIFARISNLVTVRSDMFTAYILVRIGTDGPQKRYMVILDRSGVKTLTDPNCNRVSIKAFQTVPEAR